MRTRILACLVVAGMSYGARGAVATTDRELFEKKLRRYALDIGSGGDPSTFVRKAKMLCTCVLDPNLSEAAVAGVVAYDRVTLGSDVVLRPTCYTAIFSSDGSLSTFFPCVAWEPLAK